MIRKGDIISYEPKMDFRNVVVKNLLTLFVEKGIIELVKSPSKNKIDKMAVMSTIDLEADKIVHILVENNIKMLKDISPTYGKIIKPLYLFLDKEVLLYAKLNGLKFKQFKEKKDKLSKFINELEKKHPEIKRAVINSYLELER